MVVRGCTHARTPHTRVFARQARVVHQSTGERKKVPLAVSTPPCGLPVWCVRARAHALTRTRAQVKSPLTGRHINVDGPAFQKVIDLGYIYIDDQLVCCRHCDLWSDLRGRASPSAKAGGC